MNAHEAPVPEELVNERLVRPYAITRGRTAPNMDVAAMVTLTGIGARPDARLEPEHDSVVALCQRRPLSLAEISAHLRLPLGTVHVLVSDLAAQLVVHVHYADPDVGVAVVERVLSGLRCL